MCSHKYEKETIKCWCGWDSKIARVNLLVIYYDIICPHCGSIVIHGIHGKKPEPWKKDETWIPEKPSVPIKKKKWDEPDIRHSLRASVFKRLENSTYV